MTVTATKIPALRFPEFEGEWEEKPLSGVGENIIGLTYSPSDVANDETGVIVLRSSNIKEDQLNLEDLVRVRTQLKDKLKIKKHDIVICTRNGSQRLIGKNIFIQDMPEELTFGAFMSVFRSKYNNFIVHLFKTDKYSRQIYKNLGARINQITTKSLNSFKFLFPLPPEQQKIAAFLTTIDTRIQQLSRKKALLEQYKKGVMQQIFSQEIRFKDEEGKEFPAWEEKRLGEAFTFCQTNSLSRSLLNYERGAVKNIHYGDIHTKFPTIFDLSKEEVPFINESVDLSKIADENYCKVGDLIIADASEDYKDVGKAIEVVNLAGQTLLAGLHTLIVRDVKNQTVTGFKGYMMQTYNVRQQIMRTATGISVLGISKGNLSKVKLLLPSPPEQQKIAAFLSTIDRQIKLVSQQLNRMQAFKKGLLQQLFV
jgi:type I restriction enzyme, S subunit